MTHPFLLIFHVIVKQFDYVLLFMNISEYRQYLYVFACSVIIVIRLKRWEFAF